MNELSNAGSGFPFLGSSRPPKSVLLNYLFVTDPQLPFRYILRYSPQSSFFSKTASQRRKKKCLAS